MRDSSLISMSWWLTGLIVPEMTYNVLSGTLSNQPTNQASFISEKKSITIVLKQKWKLSLHVD